LKNVLGCHFGLLLAGVVAAVAALEELTVDDGVSVAAKSLPASSTGMKRKTSLPENKSKG
jgi:hypothetical protein